MQVGIIGSGKVGKALGSWFAAAGFPVLFTSRDQEHAKEAAQSAGHNAKSTTIVDLLRVCEIVLLTVPYDEVGRVLSRFARPSPVKPWLTSRIRSLLIVDGSSSGIQLRERKRSHDSFPRQMW
jgi:prephenate dehydrogenase